MAAAAPLPATAAQLFELRAKLEERCAAADDAADVAALLAAAPPRDSELRRFAANASGNLDKASHLYLKMRRWRAENKVDGILSEGGAEERERANLQHMTYYKGLRDKRGRPLIVWKTGAVKARALMEANGNEGVLRNHIYCKEGIMAQARAEIEAAAAADGEPGQSTEEMVVICDLEGLGLHVSTQAIPHFILSFYG